MVERLLEDKDFEESGPRRLADLLPDAFGPDDLARIAP